MVFALLIACTPPSAPVGMPDRDSDTAISTTPSTSPGSDTASTSAVRASVRLSEVVGQVAWVEWEGGPTTVAWASDSEGPYEAVRTSPAALVGLAAAGAVVALPEA